MSSLDQLFHYLGKLPGIGPRSAKRLGLHVLKQRDALMLPLADILREAAENVKECSACGNFDAHSPCAICEDPKRDKNTLCVVEDVADIWAMERGAVFRGQYHVLGGSLSAIEGRSPSDLRLHVLLERLEGVNEVIIATSATVDGQTTAHYISHMIKQALPHMQVTRLAQGVPVGGELDYLDEGTIGAALEARKVI